MRCPSGLFGESNHEFLNLTLKLAQFHVTTYALMASEAALDAPASYLEDVRQEYARRRATAIEYFGAIAGVEISIPRCLQHHETSCCGCRGFLSFCDNFNLDCTTLMLTSQWILFELVAWTDQIRFAFVLNSEKIIKGLLL